MKKPTCDQCGRPGVCLHDKKVLCKTCAKHKEKCCKARAAEEN